MIKKLLFTALGMATLTAGAQMNAGGDGYSLNLLDATSQCLINVGLPNNGGIMNGDGTSISSYELTANGWELTGASAIDAKANATWFSIPSIEGVGEEASCSNMFAADKGINMASNSSISVTAKGAVGSTLEIYLGGLGQWGPATSTFNSGGATIVAAHTFASADAETFTLDFNALDATVWSGFAEKNKIQSVGFRAGTANASFTVSEIKFGAEASTSGGGGGGGGGGTGSSCNATVYTGADATFYNLIENGSSSIVKCSYDVADVKGGLYGALDKGMLLTGSAATYCGMCVSMTGPAGTATVRIVDECPDCHENSDIRDIDLSPAAFAAVIGAESVGRGKMSWEEVSCPFSTPLHVIVQGSNEWSAKVIIGGAVNRVAKVEVEWNGSYHAMTHTVDNAWEKGSMNGTSKNFKITDIFGEVVTVTGVDFSANPTNSKTNATGNFTACGAVDVAQIDALDYVSVYPNPATDQVTFAGIAGVTELVVVSTLGEVVATQSLAGSTDQVTLNTSSLASGLYVVRMTNGSNVYTSTFVKQ